MKKRSLRAVPCEPGPKPSYPTLDEFNADRRAFLARLGGLLGLAGLASACGGRAVGATDDPDASLPMGGVADAMPPGDPDMTMMGGVADAMPPPGDTSGTAPDMPAPLDTSLGVADAMPPELDSTAADVRPDLGGPAGVPPAPDAEVDGGGSCPNP